MSDSDPNTMEQLGAQPCESGRDVDAQSTARRVRDTQTQLSFAQWVLERNLHWIGAAETKTGVIVALDTAMLGGLAAAFSTLKFAEQTAFAHLFCYVSVACLVAGLFCASMSVWPRPEGPPTSFVFFGKIAVHSAADYADRFKRADDAALLEDCLGQIHRNAQIACAKFDWVRKAMMWSFGAVLPWVGALTCLLQK